MDTLGPDAWSTCLRNTPLYHLHRVFSSSFPLFYLEGSTLLSSKLKSQRMERTRLTLLVGLLLTFTASFVSSQEFEAYNYDKGLHWGLYNKGCDELTLNSTSTSTYISITLLLWSHWSNVLSPPLKAQSY